MNLLSIWKVQADFPYNLLDNQINWKNGMYQSGKESISERIKRLRHYLVLTQVELSTLSGTPLPTIKDIERGVTSVPRVKTLRALAHALQVSASYLRNGDSALDKK